jgi:predicted PurR-regulated permease PerM
MIERHTLDITWGSLWKVLFFVLIAVIATMSQQILLGLFLAIVISSGLEFIVSFLERRGVPRTLGVILIFLVGVLVVLVLAYWILPLIIIDINAILSTVNKSAANYWLGPLLNFQSSRSINLFINRISSQLFSGDLSPLSTISDILGGFGLAVAILVSSFYLSLSRDGVDRFIRAVFPLENEGSALKIYHRSRHKIGVWFRSQIILSLTMGGLTWVALSLLGVKHVLVISILAGLFELVPFVGPILSGTLAVLSALPISSMLAITTLIVFLILHQFENHVLVPLMSQKAVGLHPVIVIIALLIGIEIEGLLGGLIAVPAAAVIQEIVEEWSSQKRPPRPDVALK